MTQLPIPTLLVLTASFVATPFPVLAGPPARLDASPSIERGRVIRIPVLVQDYAGLSGGLLQIATATAGQVFARAGIEIEWTVCRAATRDELDQCAGSSPSDARVLRILSREMTAKLPTSGVEFGRAFLVPDGSRGMLANVYWGRIRRLASGQARLVSLRADMTPQGLKEARILGYALAHELAHLGGVRHSKAGVMSRRWNRGEVHDLLHGVLRFGKLEAVHLRRGLLGASR